MECDAKTADLVLVMGTSLSGLSADYVVTETARRARGGKALGAVGLNLQQTPEDGKMTLRLFGKSDDILPELLHELGYGPITRSLRVWPHESRALVPYDSDGKRLAENTSA